MNSPLQKTTRLLLLLLAGTALFWPTCSLASAAQPVLKNGSCPSGYRTSGQYCIPRKNAHFAIEKVGSCPTGYRTSGNYCLANKNAGFAIPKNGNCPTGYRTSGAYCIAR
jgi:hypothetical protein